MMHSKPFTGPGNCTLIWLRLGIFGWDVGYKYFRLWPILWTLHICCTSHPPWSVQSLILYWYTIAGKNLNCTQNRSIGSMMHLVGMLYASGNGRLSMLQGFEYQATSALISRIIVYSAVRSLPRGRWARYRYVEIKKHLLTVLLNPSPSPSHRKVTTSHNYNQ